MAEPAYVTGIDPETNTVVLGDEEDLERNDMKVGRINMIKYDTITPGMEAVTKIRYKDSGALSNLCILCVGNEWQRYMCGPYENVKGIAPGQSAVFYEGDDVIGGGVIQDVKGTGNLIPAHSGYFLAS